MWSKKGPSPPSARSLRPVGPGRGRPFWFCPWRSSGRFLPPGAGSAASSKGRSGAFSGGTRRASPGGVTGGTGTSSTGSKRASSSSRKPRPRNPGPPGPAGLGGPAASGRRSLDGGRSHGLPRQTGGQEGQQENGPCPDGTEPGGEQHPRLPLITPPPTPWSPSSTVGTPPEWYGWGPSTTWRKAPPTTGISPRHHSRPVGRFSRQNTSTHDAHNRAGAANQNPWPIRPRIPLAQPVQDHPVDLEHPQDHQQGQKGAHRCGNPPGQDVGHICPGFAPGGRRCGLSLPLGGAFGLGLGAAGFFPAAVCLVFSGFFCVEAILPSLQYGICRSAEDQAGHHRRGTDAPQQ